MKIITTVSSNTTLKNSIIRRCYCSGMSCRDCDFYGRYGGCEHPENIKVMLNRINKSGGRKQYVLYQHLLARKYRFKLGDMVE